tara:strand:- start:34 stop:162 length:129 start_codon:yes stop_codon:yes gene_type:complete
MIFLSIKKAKQKNVIKDLKKFDLSPVIKIVDMKKQMKIIPKI